MKRILWLLPLLLLLLACGPTTSPLPSPDATVGGNTAVSPSTSADETGQETATESTNETVTQTEAPMATDLADFVPVNSVEQAAQIRPQDWRKGAAEPAISIIEYGDFQ
ncbi:MAG: hypothetical protein H6657_19040 [Ardenticatenaceae bacterium]|nr:hypothetical protein [Ardenticatenaceae bacterium]